MKTRWLAVCALLGCQSSSDRHEVARVRAPVVVGAESALSPGPVAATRGYVAASAFGSGVHLVVFQDEGNFVRFARFKPDGTSLDSPAVRISTSSTIRKPSVCFDGTQFVTVREEGIKLFARVVRADGTMGSDIDLGRSYPDPRLACAAGTNAIFWKDFPAGKFVRFKSDGSLLDTTPRSLPSLTESVDDAVTDGTGFFVTGSTISGGTQAVVTRVGADGTTSWTKNLGFGPTSVTRPVMAWASTPAQLLVAHGGGLARLDAAGALVGASTTVYPKARLGSEGTQWLIAYGSDATTEVAHVDAAGTVTKATAALTSGYEGVAAISTDASAHLLTFSDARGGLAGYFVKRADLATTGPFAIVPGPSAQRAPTAAYAPSGTGFAAWLDERLAQGLYFIRTDATGKAIDSSATLLFTASNPVSTYGAGAFHLAWQGSFGTSNIMEIKTDGTLGTTFPLNTYDLPRALAFDGTDVLVGVLAADRNPALIRTKPGVAVTATAVVAATGPATGLSLAADATRAILAYSREVACTACVHNENVFVVVVKPDDTVLPPVDVLPTDDVDSKPAIGLIGSRAFLAWSSFKTAGAGAAAGQISFARVLDSPSATPMKLADVANATGVRMVSDGAGLFVGFADDAGLRVVRVAGGAPSVTAPVVVANVPVRDWTIATIAPRKLLALYRVEQSLMSRTITFGGDFGQACAAASDCDSGFCVDGVCCTSACTGQCEACDVAGLEGSCAPATGRPHGARPACTGIAAGSECGSQCLGVSRTACAVPGAGVACSKDSCSAGTETHAGTCDGAGACSDVPVSCGGHLCNGLVCATVCAAKSDCLAGYYCKDSKCVPLGGLGKACKSAEDCVAPAFCTEGVCCEAEACGAAKTCAGTAKAGTCAFADGQDCSKDDECGSGHCVDGVCCDVACDDVCAACDLSSRRGVCTAVAGKPHGKRSACPTDAANPCASRACDGTDPTTCAAFTASGTVCALRSCHDGRLTDDARCDGTGACVAPEAASCGGYACASDQECRTRCGSAADCLPGYSCEGERCVPQGSTCSPDLTAAVNDKDGTATPCQPYACNTENGRCRASCTSASDCLDGLECGSDAVCREPLSVDSGGCRSGRGGTTGMGAIATLVGLALAISRRARARCRASSSIDGAHRVRASSRRPSRCR